MADYTVYNTTSGRIINIAVGASSTADLEMTPDQSALDGIYSREEYWVVDGVAVLRPPNNITLDKTSVLIGESCVFTNTESGIFYISPTTSNAINVYEAETFNITDSTVEFIADKPATFNILIDQFPKLNFETTITVSK